jgi:hypothetical protein
MDFLKDTCERSVKSRGKKYRAMVFVLHNKRTRGTENANERNACLRRRGEGGRRLHFHFLCHNRSILVPSSSCEMPRYSCPLMSLCATRSFDVL